jgi:metal-responsive CopG/Arc/MetJ family transcriptional regulator
MVIARKQTLVQLTDELVRKLDARAAGEGKSRSGVIRDAIEAHLEGDFDEEIAREYREAYTRLPQTEEELEWADFAVQDSLRMLDEEEGEDGW